MELIVYLIGQMTADAITHKWRSDLEAIVDSLPEKIRKEIRLINPCGNVFSQKMFDSSQKDKLKFRKNVERKKQSKIFPAIDKKYVKEDSNSCICNANHYTPNTPFIGTLFELAWYHDQPWKPVVGVFDGDYKKDYLCMHSFVQDTVHTWVKKEQEAIELLVSLMKIRS